ncbi:MAG: serine/threonine protein kinase, partial [Phycisphaerales bacterium]
MDAPRSSSASGDGGGSAGVDRWSEAWDLPLDPEASESWMRLREELDPLLEQLDSTGSLVDPSTVAHRLEPYLAALRLDADRFEDPPGSKAAGASQSEHRDGELVDGSIFGGCEIVRLAGRGGMGEVYEAIDRTLGIDGSRRVALKLLPSDREAGRLIAETLHRDVAALARLEHPSIARLYRAGVDRSPDRRERPYLVTEFVDGVPMLGFVADRCGRDSTCRSRLAIELGERLAEAVAASHAAGVVHRDLKSSNVLVREDGSIAVVDFGIAALLEPVGGDERTLADRLTMQPDAAGSLSGISPERARGRFGGPREDVWAIGVLLFETAAARRPVQLEGLSIYEAIRRIGDAPPPPIRAVAPSVPRDLAVVIDRCLAFDPADRYPNAAAVRDELALVRQGFAPRARPIGVIGRSWRLAKRHPAASLLLVAVMASLLAGALVASGLALEARRSQAIAEDREHVVRSVADGLLVEVAEALRTIPGATAARQRLLEIGLAYAAAVGDDEFLASDREAALELARAVFTLGEVHRLQQPNPDADELGREAFARAAELARLAAQASGDFDTEALGFVAHAEAIAIDGRGATDERVAAWLETITLAEAVLEVDPQQHDALIGLTRSALRIGDGARLGGDRDRAMEFFTKALEASTRLVEAHPDRPRVWFHHGSSLNSMWWLLYTQFREGNEARILETIDGMVEASRRQDAIASTTNTASEILISEMFRTFLAIEFGLIGRADAEALLAENEAAIVAISEAEPEIGLLRRRRVEAHLRRGDALAMFVEQARAQGDQAEAQRLAAEAAICFETGAEVQRERLA